MQDLHPITGRAPARFFPTGGGLSGADAASFVDPRLRPSPQQNLKCPRCDSPNTKFCYYNNYNLSQPRYFCKSCRRYWTKGGVLRNVPVGGGCRKSSKRSAASTTSSTSSSTEASRTNSSSSRSTSAADNGSTSFTPPPTATTNPSDASPVATEIVPPTTATTTRTPCPATTAGYSFPDLHAFRLPPPQRDGTQIKAGADDSLLGAANGVNLSAGDLGFVDQTAPLRLPPLPDRRSGCSDELTEIDWQGCLDTTVGLFDPAVGADQDPFWSHGQWSDLEPTPYFP